MGEMTIMALSGPVSYESPVMAAPVSGGSIAIPLALTGATTSLTPTASLTDPVPVAPVYADPGTATLPVGSGTIKTLVVSEPKDSGPIWTPPAGSGVTSSAATASAGKNETSGLPKWVLPVVVGLVLLTVGYFVYKSVYAKKK